MPAIWSKERQLYSRKMEDIYKSQWNGLIHTKIADFIFETFSSVKHYCNSPFNWKIIGKSFLQKCFIFQFPGGIKTGRPKHVSEIVRTMNCFVRTKTKHFASLVFWSEVLNWSCLPAQINLSTDIKKGSEPHFEMWLRLSEHDRWKHVARLL